jgi:hypothetical protein
VYGLLSRGDLISATGAPLSSGAASLAHEQGAGAKGEKACPA